MNDEIRAVHAKALLENPIFIEALERINQSINREMDKIKNDEKHALSLVKDRQAVNKVIQYVVSVAENHKVTEFNQKKRFSLRR